MIKGRIEQELNGPRTPDPHKKINKKKRLKQFQKKKGGGVRQGAARGRTVISIPKTPTKGTSSSQTIRKWNRQTLRKQHLVLV